MGERENSKKLESKIDAALARYRPLHETLSRAEKSLAEQVIALVEKAGGRASAAEKMGVGATTLDNYRAGKTQPKILELLALCEAAGVPLSDIFERDAGFGADTIRVVVSPERFAGPELFDDLFAEIGEMVADLHKNAGLSLTRNNEYRLAAEGYNRLTDRAFDPYNLEELRSMLPWLRVSFKRDIEEQRRKPGSGKHSA